MPTNTTDPAAREHHDEPSAARAINDRFRLLEPRHASILIAVAAISFGFVALFARGLSDAGMASPAVAMYRYLLTAIATMGCLPLWRSIGSHRHLPITFPALTRPPLTRTQRHASWWALGSGAMMGFGWIAYVEALERVDVATVGVIYLTFPAFTMLAAWKLFDVHPHPRAIAGAGIVIVAAAVAIGPGSIDVGWAVLIAFGAPASFGLSIAVLTERLSALGPMERLSLVAAGAVLGLVPLLVQLPMEQVLPQSGSAWLQVAGIGIGTSLIPMTIYSFAAPVIGAARTAVIGGLELPTLFLIGVAFFGESISLGQLGAGLLILTAIVATPARSSSDLRRMALPSEELADSEHGIRHRPDRRTALHDPSGAQAPRPRS